MRKFVVLALVILMIVPVFVSANTDICQIPDLEKFEGNPIVSARKPGADGKKYFDSTAVTDPCVVYADGKFHMWYTGYHTWIGDSGSQAYIGYAVSNDGKNFTRVDGNAGGTEAPGAVLSPGENTDFDGMSVFAPSVVYQDGLYWMFYVGRDSEENTSIGLAKTKTPIYWQKLGQVIKPTNENSFDGYQVGSCSVIYDDGKWKMWYAGQSKVDSRWRIGYATSILSSPTSWTKMNGGKSQGAVLDIGSRVTDFDRLCVRHPSAVKSGNCYYMCYDTSMRDKKSSKLGIATSQNGMDWEKRNVILDVGQVGEFDARLVANPCLMKDGLVYKLYYCNHSDVNSGIGLATSGDMPTNIGSGIFKADCKLGDGFDFSLGNKTTDPTLADLKFDCGYGLPRMCGRFIKMDTDFEHAECVPADGYPAITSINEKCAEIREGETYAFKTIGDQNYAIIKITGMWQDPTDSTHWEITIKWKYQANGSNCFIAGSSDPPRQPYNLSCQSGDMTCKLTWTCAFSASDKQISYYVYRADDEDEARESTRPIHDFPVSVCSFTDHGLENGKTYYYIVRSVDQYGNVSEASNECFCTPQAVHPPSFPMPPASGVEGEGTMGNPFIVQENPFSFDWCGFPPSSIVIIQGHQYTADGSGCIHVILDLKDGTNAIDYTVITPTGESFSDTVYFEIKDTSVHVELVIGSKIIKKNDQEIKVDVAPYLDSSSWRTMVPIRHVTEALGAIVKWDGTQRKVTVTMYCGTEVLNKMEMWIGEKTYLINGVADTMDMPPVIKYDRTYVPFRFVAEAMGATVGWIQETQTVTYDYTPPSNCP